ncbi:MAG: DNA repair protein RecN, partial [Clostridiales bacterium]|nr:DNA repair protein RecN [Clostridiales bacterium]
FIGNLDFSPEEYDRLEMRLSYLHRLSKKYGGDEKELIEKLQRAKQELDEIEYSDDRLSKLSAQLEKQREEVLEKAKRLTKARKNAANELEKRIVSELKDLSMPSVQFLVDITPISNSNGFDATGADVIKFLMSANKGEKPGAISKIASGGELSRIMLAMKNVFSEKDEVETLVFDEIDTGVSGIAAQRVGEKLAELSRRKQVLCVTHLPQIAAMADTHFLIEKAERDGRTYTSVTELDQKGRKYELARLHGGDNITENTLLSAGEQLEAAEMYKKDLC